MCVRLLGVDFSLLLLVFGVGDFRMDRFVVGIDLRMLRMVSRMGRKRARASYDLSSSDGLDSSGSDDVQCTQNPSMDCDSYISLDELEDDSSSDNSGFNRDLYEKCLKNYKRMKAIKRKLEKTLKHQSKQKNVAKKTQDGFTRFSVTAFTNVISSLSDHQKAVIGSYGFGSLLNFDKCFVPNKFAQWVAHLVDPKSGDIIRDGKVISLTEDSVRMVLDLPLSKKPFPSDPSVGRDLVLSRFGKDRIPPVSFFADKLTKKEQLSDEDMFICFMVVALSNFLCPNSNSLPSPKYFGVFEDIDHMKDFNWCGYVLDWLLEHIKAFNRGDNEKARRCQSLGGCLYYLVVVYLDHIDFRQRQVPDFIPRITVWKADMIQFYANLDVKTPGVYGYRPLLEYEKTCYFKAVSLRSISSVDDLDVDFCNEMERVSGCTFPMSLKIEISKLIDEHCFKCGMSLNMDITSLGNVSKEFQSCLAKMMKHICSTDTRSKDLIVSVLNAISRATNEDPDGFNADDKGDGAPVPVSSTQQGSGNGVLPSASKSAHNVDVGFNEPVGAVRKSSNVLFSQSVKPSVAAATPPIVSSFNGNIGSSRGVLREIKNGSSESVCRKKHIDLETVVIDVDKENVVVPDSVSPSPARHCSRLGRMKMSQGCRNGSGKQGEDDIVMYTIPFTDDRSPQLTPKVSIKVSNPGLMLGSGKKAHASSSKENDSSPVVYLGSKSFLDSVKKQTKKTDAMYNSNIASKKFNKETHSASLGKTHGFPVDSSVGPESVANRSDFKVRDSSTGGKVPFYGPRRMYCPNRSIFDGHVTSVQKFVPSKSQTANYNAICELASSRSSNLDALYFGGVRSTYWSLGESMKPGGTVNNYVMASFAYHLFSRPDGHPDISKLHYFFPNISDNLLKDHDVVSGDQMMKAFERSPKARPLYQMNLLYFPTMHEGHWFVFVVNIKDKQFVFLDSLYSEDHAFQQYVSEKMITEFKFWWGQIVKHALDFKGFGVKYPHVPKHTPYDEADSGIYAMMFLEHWTSPRSPLLSLFDEDHIPNIRIKLTNEMFFNPRNTGNKNPVITFGSDEVAGSE